MIQVHFKLNTLSNLFRRLFGRWFNLGPRPMAIPNQPSEKLGKLTGQASSSAELVRVNPEKLKAQQSANVVTLKPAKFIQHPVINFVDFDAMCNQYRGIEWLVDGLIQRGSVNFIYGPSQAGKTYFCMELAHAVTSGRAFLDIKVRKTSTLYLGLEGASGLKGRWQAVQKVHGKADGLQMTFDAINVFDKTTVEALLTQSNGAGLIIIDTLSAGNHGLDENHANFTSMLLANFRPYLVNGGALVIVHHTGKSDTGQMRGSSSLLACADTAIHITREQDKSVWTVPKMRDGVWDKQHAFQMVSVELHHPNGETSTSAVIEHLGETNHGAATTSAVPSNIPTGTNIDLLRPVIENLCREHPNGIEDKHIFEACITKLQESDAQQNRVVRESRILRQRAKEVLEKLVLTGYLIQEQGQIRLFGR